MPQVRIDGKHFQLDGDRFLFRGVTYGTFRPRDDGHRFPRPAVVDEDLATMADAGFTVVRTYTVPPDDVLDAAGRHGLKLLTDIHYPDWRYLVGSSRRERRDVLRFAEREVAEQTRRLAGDDRVLALSLGNEIPADVIRWFGTDRVARALHALTGTVRDLDPDRLVTYANYPTAEYLPLGFLDFLTFNVFLEERNDLRRYLTRLQHLAGDRPLVLGEFGLDAGEGPESEKLQATSLEWQFATAVERGVAGTCVFSWTDEWWVGDQEVEGWNFGLTRTDRSPRLALNVAEAWNRRTVADLDRDWPSMSVVICAYNAAATLDECLAHTCDLDYPDLEIIVVDDGSEDATLEIARRHPRVRTVPIEHAGLSAARNAGLQAATNDIVAYLDSDAYPTSEWPYYLTLGFDGPMVGGVGGPNVPPPDGGRSAHAVSRAPGGPVHVLVSDDRAEHVPGCNMAFWRTEVLEEIGGFDPIYDAAGDDVDLCWRVLDRGWQIGFHPAALVWHHRRADARGYLRQQFGYGRAEALVEARHPDRFTSLGTAHWHGRIYDSFAPALTHQRVYRGLYGTAAYQSVYRGGGHVLDIAHQVGVPTAVAAIATLPLALVDALLAIPACLGAVTLLTLAVIDAVRTSAPRNTGGSDRGFRLMVAGLHLAQPLVRLWGRLAHARTARRTLTDVVGLPGPARLEGGTLILPAVRPRRELASDLVDVLRANGLRALPSTGWEDHDARLLGSTLVSGDVLTSAYPDGCLQVRIRVRPRVLRLAGVVGAIAVMALVGLPLPIIAGACTLTIVELVRGVIRVGPGARRTLTAAAR
ncbi:MAG: glycosyltransferase [Actinobacteria bacterium]|nr:glycosyltransferase [Actinomycetota bacterium]